jgi:hypothetical protein
VLLFAEDQRAKKQLLQIPISYITPLDSHFIFIGLISHIETPKNSYRNL